MILLPSCPCCTVNNCDCSCGPQASYFTNVQLEEPLVCGSITYGVDDVLYIGGVAQENQSPPGIVDQAAVAALPEKYCNYWLWLDQAIHSAVCSISCSESRGYVATKGIYRAFARVCSPSPAVEDISDVILDQTKTQFTQLTLSCRPEEIQAFSIVCLATEPECTNFVYYDPLSPGLSCN